MLIGVFGKLEKTWRKVGILRSSPHSMLKPEIQTPNTCHTDRSYVQMLQLQCMYFLNSLTCSYSTIRQ